MAWLIPLILLLFVVAVIISKKFAEGYFVENRQKLGNSSNKTRRIKADKTAHKDRLICNEQLYNLCKNFGGNNVITRHAQVSCHDLYTFDVDTALCKKRAKLNKLDLWAMCYGCNKLVRKTHPVYIYSCFQCGERNQQFRHYSTSQAGKVCLVTGGRSKLGHQIALKLLRTGADVIITTRNPLGAIQMFEKYPDTSSWISHLNFSLPLDFDVPNLQEHFESLRCTIDKKFGKLDVLINCAAQTIRAREKLPSSPDSEKNRYGDDKFVHSKTINSWNLEILDTPQYELEEVLRINGVAPFMLIKVLHPLLVKSDYIPYIINVHAKEGLFNVQKSKYHIHTNMAKAALSMLTKCLIKTGWQTNRGKPFRFHGCDPGWISVDEYYEDHRPFVVPPLDEIDGAARILYPLFKEIASCGQTRRHYETVIV